MRHLSSRELHALRSAWVAIATLTLQELLAERAFGRLRRKWLHHAWVGLFRRCRLLAVCEAMGSGSELIVRPPSSLVRSLRVSRLSALFFSWRRRASDARRLAWWREKQWHDVLVCALHRWCECRDWQRRRNAHRPASLRDLIWM